MKKVLEIFMNRNKSMYRGSSICDNKLYFDPPIHATMFRDNLYKLNVYHDISKDIVKMKGQMFDMYNDPLERNDLWNNADYVEKKIQLLGRLINWMVSRDVIYNGSRGGDAFPDKSQWSLNNPL